MRADFADMGRRLRAVRAPILVIRAEHGLAPDRPAVLAESAMERIRACAPYVVEHTVADTTHYTIALADPGASTVGASSSPPAAACRPRLSRRARPRRRQRG